MGSQDGATDGMTVAVDWGTAVADGTASVGGGSGLGVGLVATIGA